MLANLGQDVLTGCGRPGSWAEDRNEFLISRSVEFRGALSVGAREGNGMRTSTKPDEKDNGMKTLGSFATRNLALAALLLAAAGCGTTSGYKQADKTGERINTFRNDVAQVKGAVEGSLKALAALEASASTDPRKAYEAYAKSVDKVEAASETAKKNAEKMQAQGAEYFKEWETQLASVKSEEIRKLAMERRAKLQETFGSIKTAAQDAKQSLPPFLSDLKDLRTALGSDITVQGIDAAKGTLQKTRAAGNEVQKHLDTLVAELNTVVASITASRAQAK